MRIGIIRRGRAIALAAMVALGLNSCTTYNEELGRNQLLIGSSQQMAQAAAGAWTDVKKKERISTDPRYTSRLNRVAPKIIRAAGGDPSQWEYVVFDSKQLNAFALPGGKIGVYTGIMDIMENDAQLAAVVGHEVAHVKYKHGQERYSQGTLAQLGLAGAQIVGLSQCRGKTGAEAQACQQNAGRWAQVLGVGAVYGVILPYSRTHELEADTGGVRYMAKAGYDPREAIKFWTRMAQASQGQARPPEFASTHPATQTRIENLRREVAKMGFSGS